MENKYKKIDINDFENIKTIIGDDERALFKDEINPDYAHDELGGIEKMPDILVKANTTKEISDIMKYAYEHHIPVTARG